MKILLKSMPQVQISVLQFTSMMLCVHGFPLNSWHFWLTALVNLAALTLIDIISFSQGINTLRGIIARHMEEDSGQ